MNNQKPTRDPAVETTSMADGHAVLIFKNTDWAHSLNPLAAIVWEFCDGKNTIDDIVSQMQELLKDAEPRPELRVEVVQLIEQFEQDGLIIGE